MLLNIEEYKLGEPWKLTKESTSAAVPIIRKNTSSRNYTLVQEVKDVELKDTGSISAVEVTNNTDTPVFLRKGTILEGDTQERAVVVGRVIIPHKTTVVTVQCVHASKGIRAGARFRAGGYSATPKVMKSLMARRSQGDTWRAASADCNTLFSMSDSGRVPTGFASSMQGYNDDLVGTLKSTTKFSDEIEKALEQIPSDLDGQVGIAIVDVKGVVGFEVFNHQDSWRAFSKSVARNYANILAADEEQKLFSLNLEEVNNTVIAFMNMLNSVQAKGVVDETYEIHNDKIDGEYTMLDGEVIHLIAMRKDKNDESETYPPHRIIGLRAGRGVVGATNDFQSSNFQSRTVNFNTISPTETPIGTEHTNFLTKKDSLNILKAIQKTPMTWSSLTETVDLSEKTLASRLKTAKNLGLVDHQAFGNGRKRYAITRKGEKLIANEV